MSRAHVHRMGIKLYVTPLNYNGIVEIENIIDGSVINFCDAPRFKVKHTYLTANKKLEEKGAYIEVATRDNDLHVGVGSYLEAVKNGENVIKTTQFGAFGEQAVEFNDFDGVQGETVEVTKYVSIYTERDVKKEEILASVAEEIRAFRALGFEEEFKAHQAVYAKMWEEANIQIQGDFELDRAIRFNVYHLMSTGNEHDDRVNIGAKLLSGEEYGGHAFWDTELFMLPFFAYVFPPISEKSGNISLPYVRSSESQCCKKWLSRSTVSLGICR